MGFLVSNSCLLHSTLYTSSIFSSSSSPSSLSSSQFASPHLKYAARRQKSRSVPTASLRQELGNDTVLMRRTAVLLVGVSVFPSLIRKAIAIDVLPTDESELRTPEGSKQLEGDTTPSPFISILNGIGIFGAGVLGALYALAQKDKKSKDEIIESMKIELEKKESSLVSMEKNFESRLLNEQEEQTKQLKKGKEEQLVLSNQLSSANITITGLGQELKNEKRLCTELKFQIETLQSSISKADEGKKDLEEKLKKKLDSIELLQDRINLLSSEVKDQESQAQNLTSFLSEKESTLKNLNSNYEKSKDELKEAYSEIERLKVELLEKQDDLESKSSTVKELNARISSVMVERDDYKTKLNDTTKNYDDLKLSYENHAASTAQRSIEVGLEIHELEEKLKQALHEVSGNEATITNLTQEKENLKTMLDIESTNVENLKHDLRVSNDNLTISITDAFDLAEQLKQSRSSCSELESELSKLQNEFVEVRDGFQTSLDDEKRRVDVLANDLISSKELLEKTRDDVQAVTHELTVSEKDRDNLQKELVDVYKKAETLANDLKEENKIVSSLEKERQILLKQVAKDKEARKTLETDLEEATKSLDEMNKNAFNLSRELENVNSRISSLEDEREVLYESLTEHKVVVKGARENMEDAHNMVVRLGEDRDGLEKRTKKLEEELGSAKGEILRLRRETNSSKKKVVVSDEKGEKDEVLEKVSVGAKKSGKRRKTSSQ